VLIGGLLIIADLTTRLILQRVGQDAGDTLAGLDEAVNALLLVTAGMAVQRETRRVAWAALAGLVAGAALLIFADPAWAHGIGVACLVLCAVSVFALAAPLSGGQD
jgi:hypothetical protein